MEKSAIDLAKKKAERERRTILVHESGSSYYVTPEEKAGSQVSDLELVDRFEPEESDGENYRRLPVTDFSTLEEGTKVIIDGENTHTISKVTPRQIVTNFGDKFRRSDGVEWGGGDKEITNKLIRQ